MIFYLNGIIVLYLSLLASYSFCVPYVRAFDYSAWGLDFFSDELVRAFDPQLFAHLEHLPAEIVDSGSLSFLVETTTERFTVKGVWYPAILDVEAGLIELTAGRAFTYQEVTDLSYVAVVSQDFLEANNLALGMPLFLEYQIFDHYRTQVLDSRIFELEIVGTFAKELPPNQPVYEISSHIEFVNRIYVPNRVIESLLDDYLVHLPQLDPELYAQINVAEDLEKILNYDSFLFLLNDPAKLVAFADTVNALLPSFWQVEDLANAYADISNSMARLTEISRMMIVGTAVATLVILGLLIFLFVIDRWQEVGIYLSLGEKQHKILSQFMLEAMLVAMLGITLALFAGNAFGNRLSQAMIEQDMMHQLEDPNRIVSHGQLHGMGFRVDLTHEEMLALFDVTLDARTVIRFYCLTLSTVSLAVAIPIFLVVNTKPKAILLKSQIG